MNMPLITWSRGMLVRERDEDTVDREIVRLTPIIARAIRKRAHHVAASFKPRAPRADRRVCAPPACGRGEARIPYPKLRGAEPRQGGGQGAVRRDLPRVSPPSSSPSAVEKQIAKSL
jgi:hypothetical protein